MPFRLPSSDHRREGMVRHGSASTVLQLNTLRPRQNGHRFTDDTFKRIFLYENVRISIKISLKFVPYGPINNNPALVQIMAWRRLGDKPLSEPMMVSLLTHLCVTRPQWVNTWRSCMCKQMTSRSHQTNTNSATYNFGLQVLYMNDFHI